MTDHEDHAGGSHGHSHGEDEGAEPEPPRGIAAAGAYAPAYRITTETLSEAWGRRVAGGVETTAVPDADEDALTMGVAAGRRALAAGEVAPSDLAALLFATTTPPDEEEDLTARLGSALGVPATTERTAYTQSTRAGTRALVAALDAEGPVLVVASDCPRGAPDDDRDHVAGAGAAAFVVRDDAPAKVVDRGTYASAAPGVRFRERGAASVDGLDVTAYDRAVFREALVGATAELDLERTAHFGLDGVHAAAVQAPDGSLPYRAADAIGVSTDAIAACATVDELGDTGAASVPLSLARGLDAGDNHLLAAAYGSGAGADVLAVDAHDPVPTDLALEGAETVSYGEYLRLRGDVTGGEPAGGGAYVSVPSWRRTIPQRHRMVAGRCTECRALAFPPEGACGDCGALAAYEEVNLPGTGTVEAVTTISQGGAPPEFAEQQARSGDFAVAIVAFDGPDGDATVSAPVQVAGPETDLAIGDAVVTTLRRIYEQEGVTRYGCKVRPAAE